MVKKKKSSVVFIYSTVYYKRTIQKKFLVTIYSMCYQNIFIKNGSCMIV